MYVKQPKKTPASGVVYIDEKNDCCKVVYNRKTKYYSERDAYYLHNEDCLPYVYTKCRVEEK